MKFRSLMVLLLGLMLLFTFAAGCAEEPVDEPAPDEEPGDEEAPEEAIDFPERTIVCNVPYAAGGGTDIMTRTVAAYWELEDLAITNIEGAAGATGTMETYHAEPDGHTLLTMGPHSLLSFYLAGTLEAPAWEEMECVGTIVSDRQIISTHQDSGFETFEDVIEYARENPGELEWATVGVGGYNHITSARIWDEADIEVKFVPFDSAARSRTELMGGHVDVLLGQQSEHAPYVESGDFIPLVVATQERSAVLPDVPSMEDLGYDVDMSLFRAYWAPPGTPAPVVEILEEEFRRITEDPEFVEQMEAELSYEVVFMGNEETRQMLQEDEEIFKDLIERYVE